MERTLQSRALAKAVTKLRKEAGEGHVRDLTIDELRDAWGNATFSVDCLFLREAMSRVMTSPGPFLDCGSGLSTLALGIVAGERGSCVWSLEQDADWYIYVRRLLAKFELNSVTLCHAPLRFCEEAVVWYDLDGLVLPKRFSHVFCDGPAVFQGAWRDPFYSNWRAGVVPELAARGITFREILLDDASDERCGNLAAIWQRHGLEVQVLGTQPDLLLLAQSSERTK